MAMSALSSRSLSAAALLTLATLVPGCSVFQDDAPAPRDVSASEFYRPAVGTAPQNAPTTRPAADASAGSAIAAPGTTGEPPAFTPPAQNGSAQNSPAVSVSEAGSRLSDEVSPIGVPVLNRPKPNATGPAQAASEASTAAPAPRAPAPAAPPAAPSAAPAAPPAAASAGPKAKVVPMGTYMTVGGVLAEVNGVPIFAARVMKELEPTLAARARDTDERAFQAEARTYITRTISEFVSEELEYATAQRNLSDQDKKVADAVTTQFREKLVTAAGGSVERAKRIAAENGDNYDDLITQQSRRNLILIYYYKKIAPRVEVTTDDMRRFYRDNVDRMFTERTEATFRLIRVDPARVGGKTQALDKIKSVRDRAAAGEDFATLASSGVNDDGSLARNKGLVGPIARNSLAMEKVEEAVFRTDAGQLTEIVEDGGRFYLAKVETRKNGSVAPFEDIEVQARIRRELNSAQFAQLREQFRAELVKNAIIRQDDRMLETALEMAVQRYPVWRAQPSRAPEAPQ